MDVGLLHPPREPFLTRLRESLAPAIRLRTDDAAGCEVLVAGVPSEEQIARCPDLRAVVIPWAGVPVRTRELLAAHPRITLHNLHHNAAPTAETALALLLAAAKRLVPIDRALRRGDWRPRYAEQRDLLLAERTALVLGYGAIGRRVAAGCRGLGMRVLAIRRQKPREEDADDEIHPPEALPDLLPRAHALFLCLPLTPRTQGLIGREDLARLPGGAVLVNVARGPIVDERALYDELRSGRLSAGLDVWWRYPEDEEARAETAPSSLAFHALDNVVMSPHRAGHSDETEALRARHLADLLNAGARGEPFPNRVDLEEGY